MAVWIVRKIMVPTKSSSGFAHKCEKSRYAKNPRHHRSRIRTTGFGQFEQHLVLDVTVISDSSSSIPPDVA